MGSIGLPELLFLPFAALALVLMILYIRTLQKAFAACGPESRTLSPSLVWLLVIPLFNVAWHFVVVLSLSRSIDNDMRSRAQVRHAQSSAVPYGLAMCTLPVLALVAILARVPLIASFSTLGAFAFWVAYWLKVAKETRTCLSIPPSLPVRR